MTKEDKVKLNGIAINANNYTHPANHSASIITQDANNRFVTDTEKTTWNNKQNALGYTPVNKAGDSMTGVLSASIGQGDSALKGHNTFQTTNLLAGVAGTSASSGEGYLATYRNNATTGAGDVRAGVYGKQGTYDSGATTYAGFFEGKVRVTGKITTAETTGSDAANTVATKGYVDSIASVTVGKVQPSSGWWYEEID